MKKTQKKLGNKGFSLVELIVVIAIMAVLVGVLAPTLIKNVEKSRESKDIQNLDSVKNAITLALNDEGVYNAAVPSSGSTDAITITSGSVQFNITSGSFSEQVKDNFNVDQLNLTSKKWKNKTIKFTVDSKGAVKQDPNE